jgi:hypothetical protein
MSRAATILVSLLVSLFVLGAGGGVYVLMRRSGPGANDYVESRIGELRLVYQAAYARFPGGRVGGQIDSLDIAATFPDLKPAGDATLPLDAPAGKAPSMVFLSIGRAERKVDPAEIVPTLYARFLDPEIVETDAGLLMRAFQEGSPYDGEDLYFAAPEGRAFSARCAKPTVPPDGLPETCIAAFREGGADVDMRFTTALLPQWEKLAEGGRALVRSMIAR